MLVWRFLYDTFGISTSEWLQPEQNILTISVIYLYTPVDEEEEVCENSVVGLRAGPAPERQESSPG